MYISLCWWYINKWFVHLWVHTILVSIEIISTYVFAYILLYINTLYSAGIAIYRTEKFATQLEHWFNLILIIFAFKCSQNSALNINYTSQTIKKTNQNTLTTQFATFWIQLAHILRCYFIKYIGPDFVSLVCKPPSVSLKYLCELYRWIIEQIITRFIDTSILFWHHRISDNTSSSDYNSNIHI